MKRKPQAMKGLTFAVQAVITYWKKSQIGKRRKGRRKNTKIRAGIARISDFNPDSN